MGDTKKLEDIQSSALDLKNKSDLINICEACADFKDGFCIDHKKHYCIFNDLKNKDNRFTKKG